MSVKVFFRGTSLKKAPKLTYSTLHPENNKQDINLVLAIFLEITSAAIMSYFPERFDTANFLPFFHEFFVICNLKTQFKSSNQLRNAVVSGGNKQRIFFGNWVGTWFACPNFTLAKHTSHALMTTLRVTSSLITHSLRAGYN